MFRLAIRTRRKAKNRGKLILTRFPLRARAAKCRTRISPKFNEYPISAARTSHDTLESGHSVARSAG